jgi:hypothetical protein
VFGNRIFGRKLEDVAGDWRRTHDVELRSLYASLNVVRVMKIKDEMAGRVAWMGEMRNTLF